MTPKEKAEKLVNKFIPYCAGNSHTILNRNLSIRCALVCVDEILDIPELSFNQHDYWLQVKSEIEKL
ncbi:MAG TPA: hypothetical protein VN192_02845 [Flavobacterium sp.]|nr:hypothetical protein [Flavobacterium sp.]